MSDNKRIFTKNLRRQMLLNNKSSTEICSDLKISKSTFSEWYNANAYPRIDKIELLANYFGIDKSDLIEKNPEKLPKEIRELAKQINLNPKLRILLKNSAELKEEDIQIMLEVANELGGGNQ